MLEYLKAESDETWALAEVIDAFKFDKKQRFALRGPASPHSKLLIPVWPYQIRANQGHSQEAVNNSPELATATAVSFFDPRPRPLLDDGEKDQTAARNGKPLEMQDEYPKRLYHRPGRASAMAIVEQGFLVGGGPEVESGKAHNYFSDKPLEDIEYKSGVRASAKFELVVDTEIAMYFGALFFRTVSDGVLTLRRWQRQPPHMQEETPCRLLEEGQLRTVPCPFPSEQGFSLLHLRHLRRLRQQKWWCPRPCCSRLTKA